MTYSAKYLYEDSADTINYYVPCHWSQVSEHREQMLRAWEVCRTSLAPFVRPRRIECSVVPFSEASPTTDFYGKDGEIITIAADGSAPISRDRIVERITSEVDVPEERTAIGHLKTVETDLTIISDSGEECILHVTEDHPIFMYHVEGYSSAPESVEDGRGRLRIPIYSRSYYWLSQTTFPSAADHDAPPVEPNFELVVNALRSLRDELPVNRIVCVPSIQDRVFWDTPDLLP